MDILITGGAGFIGLNLVKSLIKSSNKIIVVDNLSAAEESQIINICKTSEKVVFYNMDICSIEFVDFFKDYSFKKIYHLASLASPVYYKKNPIETLDVGYTGTKNVLDLILRQGNNAKMFFSSTSEVYGDPEVHPQNESYYGNVNTLGKRSCYDESKRVAETLIHSYVEKYNIDVRIGRIFNTYGPYMRLEDGRIITEIIKSIIKGSTLKIYGDGMQTRSMCYIDDMITMIHSLMNSEYKSPVNLGVDREITILDLIKISEQLFNVKINIEFEDIDIDDPKQRKPCLILNKKLLNISVHTSLESGLSKTLGYFKLK